MVQLQQMSRTIFALIDDLFFASRVRGTGEQVDARVIFVKSAKEAIQRARYERPHLFVIDLNATSTDPIAFGGQLKTDEELSTIPVLGFYSHVQTELHRAAKTAGFDQVMPRSVFSARVVEILGDRKGDQETG